MTLDLLEAKDVDRYAHSSSVSREVAESNIVLTYALKVLSENHDGAPLLDTLAFKGGTCLRKVYYGTTTRFSLDLDFTAVEIEYKEFKRRFETVFNQRSFYGITLGVEEFKRSEDNKVPDSYGATIQYTHPWNASSFDIEVSFREKICLPVKKLPLIDESYFRFIEFKPFEVPCLTKEELIAEKIRAAFQRLRPRDVYDLYIYSERPFNREKVRSLAVIKCWNSKRAFDGEELLGRIRKDVTNWEDLKRLVARSRLPSESVIVEKVCKEFDFLRSLERNLNLIKEDSKAHRRGDLIKAEIERINTMAK